MPRSRKRRGPIPKREKARYPIEARIADAAEKVFAETGRRGATLAAIARGSDLSLPTVARHVDGMDQLYREVLERITAELRDRIPAEAAEDPKAWWLAAAHALVEKPHRARLLLRDLLDGGTAVRALPGGDPAVAKALGPRRGAENANARADAVRDAAILALLTHAVLGPIATASVAPPPLRLNLTPRNHRRTLLEALQAFLDDGLPAGPVRPDTEQGARRRQRVEQAPPEDPDTFHGAGEDPAV